MTREEFISAVKDIRKKAAASAQNPSPPLSAFATAKAEPSRSRIKMIATGFGHKPFISVETGELMDGLDTIPFALTHDDRIFQYNVNSNEWTELPPLPE
jgi:hypothetical protein